MARAYFFAHFSLAIGAFSNQRISQSKTFLWFTHPDFKRGVKIDEFDIVAQNLDHIFCTNDKLKTFVETLTDQTSNSSCFIGGYDESIGMVDSSNGDHVGIVSAYYERKNPQKIIQVIQETSDKEFLLIGPSKTKLQTKGCSGKVRHIGVK